jgi:hypothetical protein
MTRTVPAPVVAASLLYISMIKQQVSRNGFGDHPVDYQVRLRVRFSQRWRCSRVQGTADRMGLNRLGRRLPDLPRLLKWRQGHDDAKGDTNY